MNIIKLETENIKKLKAVEITPKGNVVVIAGKNGNGKSSVIDSIAMVLGGKKLIPKIPVRNGQKTASITADIGEFLVTRKWTNPDTSYLKVATKDGAKISNGQDILNKIIGNLSFDPLAFGTMEPKKRVKILKEITKVNFDDLDVRRDTFYGQRTFKNSQMNEVRAKVVGIMEDIPPRPKKIESIEDIQSEHNQAMAHNDSVEKTNQLAERLKFEAQECNVKAQEFIDKGKALVERIETLDHLAGIPIDVSKLTEKMKEHYEMKKIEEQHRDLETLQSKEEMLRLDSDALTGKIEQVDKQKNDMLANAKMPIKGLSFGDNEVTFNGIPFNQLSSAEQIKVSMSMAIAMNPKLRVAMIYNGSLLDTEAMDYIVKIAKEKDMQIWIEKVADSPDGSSIFIEDGEVIH